jgi:rRNA maturation endonuclease Nob1
MKVALDPRNVTLSGGMVTKEFSVKADSHIMAILSGLYTDPVDAIVREYLTNMHDAYVALRKANPNAPFIRPILHAPTSLAQYLEFKDFGIGMSEDTIMTVFTQYGNSTKNDSNDEVGGFGIGSKTAFCYNEGSSWSIESRYNGVSYKFLAFVSERGVPTLTKVAEDATDEPSGVTINIPVRQQDIQRAQSAVVKYVPFFPMDIEVQGVTVPAIAYTMSGTGYKIAKAKADRYGYNTPHIALMGNVPYQIDTAQLHSHQKKMGKYSGLFFESNYYNDGRYFVMPFKVGELDIIPSRDGLKYSPRTVEALVKKFREVSDNLESDLNDLIANSGTVWEAATKLNALNITSAMLRATNFTGEFTAMYRGVKLTSDNLGHNRIIYSIPQTNLSAADSKATAKVYYSVANDERQSRLSNKGGFDICTTPGLTRILINDLGKKDKDISKAQRVAAGLVMKLYRRKLPSGRYSKHADADGAVILLNTSLTIEQVGTLFGGIPVEYVKTVSETMPGVELKSDAKEPNIYRLSPSSGRWEARVKVPVVAGETYYYMPLTKTHGGRYSCDTDVYSLQNYASKIAGLTDVKIVYGIRTEDVKNFDSTVWKEYVPFLTAEVRNLVKTMSANNEFEGMAYQRCGAKYPNGMWEYNSGAVKKLPADIRDVLAKFVEIEKKGAHVSPQVLNVVNMAGRLGITVMLPTVPTPTEEWRKLCEKYTALRMIVDLGSMQSYYGHDPKSRLVQYIDFLVDTMK